MKRTSERLLPMMSLREVSGSSAGAMPAAASSGKVSSKMRPLDSAIVSMAMSASQMGILAAEGKHADAVPALGDAMDARAERGELFLDPLVTAIEVIDAIDHRLAFRDQAGDDQAGGCAQIGRHDRGAGERTHALDDRRIAFDLDVRAEPLKFLHVHHAVFEYCFGNDRSVVGDGHRRHQLRLHVGRKSRIWR